MDDKLFRMIINRIQFEELYKVLSTLNINYAIVKGDVLSWYAYNELGRRRYGDIDILISESHIQELISALEAQGFSKLINDRFSHVFFLTSSHQTVPFVKSLSSKFSMTVDLNFDIFWGEYEGKRIDISEFLSDTIEIDIYGCKVKTLPPLKAMVQLILHHYKDMNSLYLLATRKSINNNMFKDVYYLWKNNQETVSLDKLYAISSKYEIIPYVFYVLYFTNWIFKDTELQKHVEAFRTSEGEALLDYYGLAENERKTWRYDFKTRLESDNLYNLIKDDLTEKDQEKITINKCVFLGGTK